MSTNAVRIGMLIALSPLVFAACAKKEDSAPRVDASIADGSKEKSEEAVLPSNSDWQLKNESDDMTGEQLNYAIYSKPVGTATVEARFTCIQTSGTPEGDIRVTVHDGDLATELNILENQNTPEPIVHTVSNARFDVGDGEIRSVVLVQHPSVTSLYRVLIVPSFGIERIINAGARPVLNGDQSTLKLEVVLDDGTKHVIKGDQNLAQYVNACKGTGTPSVDESPIESSTVVETVEANPVDACVDRKIEEFRESNGADASVRSDMLLEWTAECGASEPTAEAVSGEQ